MSIKSGLFTKSNRINKPGDYQRVFKSSCRSADEKFLVIASENDLKQARLGLAISKKSMRYAVNRNKTKRLIRESFRRHKNILKGLDIVVVSQKENTVINNKTIIESISAHWKKISQCRKF